MSADDVLLPRTAPDTELRHGYTLDQVRGLSKRDETTRYWESVALPRPI